MYTEPKGRVSRCQPAKVARAQPATESQKTFVESRWKKASKSAQGEMTQDVVHNWLNGNEARTVPMMISNPSAPIARGRLCGLPAPPASIKVRCPDFFLVPHAESRPWLQLKSQRKKWLASLSPGQTWQPRQRVSRRRHCTRPMSPDPLTGRTGRYINTESPDQHGRLYRARAIVC